MTVGIVYTNGKEAIVCADARVSQGIREIDTVNKIGTFNHKNYKGVVFGAGLANILSSVLEDVTQSEEEKSAGSFIRRIHKNLEQRLGTQDERVLVAKRRSIIRKAKLIGNKEEREAWVREETERQSRLYDDEKQGRNTEIIAVAHEGRGIQIYFLNQNDCERVYLSHIEIGSGSDGANFYFSSRTPGIDNKELRPNELAFHAIGAYTTATVNIGVGGTPRIVRIRDDGVDSLPQRDVATLTNICGAYMAESLPRAQAERMMNSVLDGKTDYSKIAQALNETETSLTKATIPAGTWQERTNYQRYNNRKN
jgi:hypothetical protein